MPPKTRLPRASHAERHWLPYAAHPSNPRHAWQRRVNAPHLIWRARRHLTNSAGGSRLRWSSLPTSRVWTTALISGAALVGSGFRDPVERGSPSPPLRPPLWCFPAFAEIDRLTSDPVPAKLVDADPEVPRTLVVPDRDLHDPEILSASVPGSRRTWTPDSCFSTRGSSRLRRNARRTVGIRAQRRRGTSRGRVRDLCSSTRSSA